MTSDEMFVQEDLGDLPQISEEHVTPPCTMQSSNYSIDRELFDKKEQEDKKLVKDPIDSGSGEILKNPLLDLQKETEEFLFEDSSQRYANKADGIKPAIKGSLEKSKITPRKIQIITQDMAHELLVNQELRRKNLSKQRQSQVKRKKAYNTNVKMNSPLKRARYCHLNKQTIKTAAVTPAQTETYTNSSLTEMNPVCSIANEKCRSNQAINKLPCSENRRDTHTTLSNQHRLAKQATLGSEENVSAPRTPRRLMCNKDIFSCMKTFMKHTDNYDLEIVVDGKIFKCHRFVLASTSTYFENMWFEKRIEIKGVTASTFETIWDTFRNGQLELTDQNIIDIYQAVKQLKIEFLVLRCENFIIDSIRLETIRQTFEYAKKFDSSRLLMGIKEFMSNHFGKKIEEQELIALNFSDFQKLFSE